MTTQNLKTILRVGLVVLLASPAGAAAPVDITRVGVAGGVQGIVKAFPPGEKPVGRVLSSGAPLYLNEKIATGPTGSLQVMLIDETVFTIGPNSSMMLDEFIYDPASHSGKVTARVTNGVFRFVTGQIGHKKPSDMKVKFPVGTMGIRGTIVAGQVSETGTTAVLLGPGPATNAPGERIGAFRLENAGAGVDIVKPGYGSHIDGLNGAPSVPAPIPQAQLATILQAVASAPQGARAPATPAATPAAQTDDSQSSDLNETSGDSADDASGQDMALAGGDLTATQSVSDLAADAGNATLTAANDIGDLNLANLISNNQATWDQVRTITDGTGYYQGAGNFQMSACNPGPCAGAVGTTSMYLDIDFGKQIVGSPASNVTMSVNDAGVGAGAINEVVNFGAASFATTGGNATLSGTSASGNGTANVSLLNINGIAGTAVGIAKYSNGGNVGAGSVTAPLTCTTGACH